MNRCELNQVNHGLGHVVINGGWDTWSTVSDEDIKKREENGGGQISEKGVIFQ